MERNGASWLAWGQRLEWSESCYHPLLLASATNFPAPARDDCLLQRIACLLPADLDIIPPACSLRLVLSKCDSRLPGLHVQVV